MMVAYIDDHKDRFGVEPICAVLPIVNAEVNFPSCAEVKIPTFWKSCFIPGSFSSVGVRGAFWALRAL